jgi:hypothetical protein
LRRNCFFVELAALQHARSAKTTGRSSIRVRKRECKLNPKRHLRFAGGRFVGYGHDQQFPAAALMEIYEGDDHLVLDHGASGAPVLDCEGRVVAVVSAILTQP